MALVSLAVAQVISGTCHYPKDFRGYSDYSKPPIYQFAFTEVVPKLDKADTFVLIFGPTQDAYLEFLEKVAAEGKIKLLFKSKKCANTNAGHYGFRNTIVILELP